MKITTKLTPVNGILLLNKPINLTSNAALQRVKRLFNARKAGHTGSLDPLATGMLPICFGDATKFSQYLLDSDKSYIVEAQLGVKTTTADSEGEIIATQPVPTFSHAELAAVLQRFVGVTQQIPPMYSAIKHQGQPLYKLARQGIEIERQPRTITIHRLELLEYTADKLHLAIDCTKGTYVRTLVEDIGERLGCGAHVSALHRAYVAPYTSAEMYTLDFLEATREASGTEALYQYLLPIESAIDTFTSVKASTAALFYLSMGQPVMMPQLPMRGMVRLYAQDGQFVGIGEVLQDGRVAPRRLLPIPASTRGSVKNQAIGRE